MPAGRGVLSSLLQHSERPLSAVPRPVLALLALTLAAQLLLHATTPRAVAQAEDLPSAPAEQVLRGMAFGDEAALARALMLWLQAFDYQPGISVPFRRLDYARLTAWLDRILALDPRSQYPLLSAARVYTEVQDDDRRRAMIDFVRARFRADPERRWPWQAHAVFIARHRLGDPALALALAGELRRYATGPQVPGWARQMELFVLEDLGELESARILLGGLIASGAVSDPHEIRFLSERFEVAR